MPRFRHWYEHERDCNEKMLAMLESVPAAKRSDQMFQRAVDLAAHLAVCRENWLDRMADGGDDQTEWFPERVSIDTLGPRYAAIEARWGRYLNALPDEELERDFEFPADDGNRYRWNIEGQIVQLVGHAFYHRGQIAMIVDDLGGEKVDTDYLFWAFEKDERWGKVGTNPSG